MTRDELIEVIKEAGEIVEQALPVGSSVLKDQLTAMITMELMHEKSPLFPPSPLDFLNIAREVDVRPVALGLTKLAEKKVKDKVWETFCYFMRQLTPGRHVTAEEMKQAFKDERVSKGEGHENSGETTTP